MAAPIERVDRDHESRAAVSTADPTALTTQQLTREITALKELVFTRLDGVEKAQDLFQATITHVPTDTDKQVGTLRDLVNEMFKTEREKFQSLQTQLAERDSRFTMSVQKESELVVERFRSVAQQFTERDVRGEQTARDSKVAVDAALQAAKEAVSEQNKSNALAISKQETATSKQIDAQAALIATSTSGLNDKIEDVKERMTRLEGSGKGKDDSVASARANIATIIAIGSAVFGVIAFVWGVSQSQQSRTAPIVIPSSGNGNSFTPPPGYTVVPIQPAQQPPPAK